MLLAGLLKQENKRSFTVCMLAASNIVGHTSATGRLSIMEHAYWMPCMHAGCLSCASVSRALKASSTRHTWKPFSFRSHAVANAQHATNVSASICCIPHQRLREHALKSRLAFATRPHAPAVLVACFSPYFSTIKVVEGKAYHAPVFVEGEAHLTMLIAQSIPLCDELVQCWTYKSKSKSRCKTCLRSWPRSCHHQAQASQDLRQNLHQAHLIAAKDAHIDNIKIVCFEEVCGEGTV